MGIEKPFMEVRGSALGTDVEHIWQKILIFANRVELHDRSGVVLQTIRYDQLADVEIHRKLLGQTLLIRSDARAEITAKALRPELATGAKAMIEKHAKRFRASQVHPPSDSAGRATEAPAAFADSAGRPALQGMLDQLHRAGILTDEELAAKCEVLSTLERR